MPARTEPARREAFFRALAQTGNQALAAERVRLSKTWVWHNRKRDPAFEARLIECTATARARLKAAAAEKPETELGAPRAWREISGDRLVVRGTNKVRAQIARARLRQWTALEERLFLARLATVGNVRLACKAAGLSVSSANKRRRTYPAFARAWEEALEIGCTRLEAALVASASNTMNACPDYEAEANFPEMTFADALRLLQIGDKRARAESRASGRARRGS